MENTVSCGSPAVAPRRAPRREVRDRDELQRGVVTASELSGDDLWEHLGHHRRRIPRATGRWPRRAAQRGGRELARIHGGNDVCGLRSQPVSVRSQAQPFAYYGGSCPANVVPLDALDADLAGNTPSFVWITPVSATMRTIAPLARRDHGSRISSRGSSPRRGGVTMARFHRVG